MQSFSQRMGIKPVKEIIQTNNIDDDLKVALWNVLNNHIWTNLETYAGNMKNTGKYHYIEKIWQNFFKKPANEIIINKREIIRYIQNFFFHNAEWYDIYDFIEFVVKNTWEWEVSRLTKDFNNVLQKELSAYRFVGNELVKITADEEIEEIEQATTNLSGTHYASTHIKEALKLLADKQNPDYRNSIKESISAVEAICTAITKASGNEASTLGAALKVIEKETHIELHPALKQAFDKLYGYTSDDGIRHFLKSDKEVDFEDAKFMLVACSAFVNYLTEKSSKAGLTL